MHIHFAHAIATHHYTNSRRSNELATSIPDLRHEKAIAYRHPAKRDCPRCIPELCVPQLRPHQQHDYGQQRTYRLVFVFFVVELLRIGHGKNSFNLLIVT